MTTRLRVGGINFYEGNKRKWADARLISSLDLDMAAVCEAASARRLLGTATGMRRIGDDYGGHSTEVVALVRKDFHVIGGGTNNVTPDLRIRTAHDRWITTARVNASADATPVRTSLISTHHNGSIIGKDGHPLTEAGRVQWYERHMEALKRAIAYERESAFAPLVVGDMNVWRGVDWKYAPEHWLGAQGLVGLDSHVDWIFYDPGQWRLISHHTVDSRGSDHKWHVATLERK